MAYNAVEPMAQEVLDAPGEGVSSLAWSPQANHLVAGCWDSKLYWWEIGGDGSSQPKDAFVHDGPVLSVCFSSDGSTVFGGGGDREVRSWNLQDSSGSTVGVHDAAVKAVRFSPELQCVVSGSWDKTVKFWDSRQQGPANVIECQERVYAMDLFGSLLVIACAGRQIEVYNLENMSKPFRTLESPMKYQTRCVACFQNPEVPCFAIGSVDGRVGIEYAQDSKDAFTFKCHRDTSKNYVYAVNDLSVHPGFGTFSTVGSDGTFNFWDKDNRTKVHNSAKTAPTSISAGQFNAPGDIFAYAVSYDWSQGASGYNEKLGNHIYVIPVSEQNVKPRPKGR